MIFILSSFQQGSVHPGAPLSYAEKIICLRQRVRNVLYRTVHF